MGDFQVGLIEQIADLILLLHPLSKISAPLRRKGIHSYTLPPCCS